MKKIITGIIIPMLIISISGLTSCKDKSNANQQRIRERAQIQVIENKIEEKVSPLPTSAEVIKILTDLEVGYIMGITNPFQNVKKYFRSSNRAINLGVYGADLSYVTLYNLKQDVINYLDAIGSLSIELNISRIYDTELYEKIEQNFDNRDELVNILTDSFNETYSYLSKNDQEPLALLVVGGAWVEGTYLITHVSHAAYLFADFARVLLEQKESLELFLEITQPYTSDPGVSDFVKLLEPIKKVYEGLTTSLTARDVDDITVAIEHIRSQCVQ